MMNKYIKVEMTPTSCGIGGSFSTEASFVLDNFLAPFNAVEVKIDTGCSISTIPLKRLMVSDAICKSLKEADIYNQTKYYLSYGVESGGFKHTAPITHNEKMNCSAMKFKHGVSDFIIGGMKISCNNIYLNYDRKGNILIGMDILENWDIHMGISKVTGTNLFLGCPLGNECQEYSDALVQHFGIIKQWRKI